MVDAITLPQMLEGFRDRELVLQFAGFANHPVHKVPTCQFLMVHATKGDELGSIRLRVGSTRHIEFYAGHIGYAVHEVHRGHGYAARSVRLLIPLAVRFGLNPLWITCDPENIASRRTLERAGARLVEIVNVPQDCVIFQHGHSQKCRYRLDLQPAL